MNYFFLIEMEEGPPAVEFAPAIANAKTSGKCAEMLDFLRRNYPDSGSRVCE
jgi:hypothetical protein